MWINVDNFENRQTNLVLTALNWTLVDVIFNHEIGVLNYDNFMNLIVCSWAVEATENLNKFSKESSLVWQFHDMKPKKILPYFPNDWKLTNSSNEVDKLSRAPLRNISIVFANLQYDMCVQKIIKLWFQKKMFRSYIALVMTWKPTWNNKTWF